MSDMMWWVAHKDEKNLINITSPMKLKFIEFYFLLSECLKPGGLVGVATPYPNQPKATHEKNQS